MPIIFRSVLQCCVLRKGLWLYMNILRFLIPKSHVAYLEETATVRNGLEKLRHYGYTAIPVISKDGLYIGTVTEGDFLWQLLEQGEYQLKLLEKRSVSELLRSGWNPPVRASETIEQLFSRLMDQNFVPVVDDRGVFVGIVTRRAVLENCVLSGETNSLHPVHSFETI